MLDEFLDELRSPMVLVYVSMLLTWCVASSSQLGDSVELEFKAYRLQQYDIVGTPHGSRSWQGKISCACFFLKKFHCFSDETVA